MATDARYDWDSHDIAHVGAHKVTPEEFEPVLANKPEFSDAAIEKDEL